MEMQMENVDCVDRASNLAIPAFSVLVIHVYPLLAENITSTPIYHLYTFSPAHQLCEGGIANSPR